MTNNYTAPVEEFSFLINQIFLSDQLLELDIYKDLDQSLIGAILQEAGKFVQDKLVPINKSGDSQGSILKDGDVITPDGFKEAYADFILGGWNGLGCEKEYGGQGLPQLLANSVAEMLSSANMAFALCPLLTQGSIELLTMHGSEEQKQKYLEKLISGKWTGTMCLTEPAAGSDIGLLTTKAVKDGDIYRIKGQKIFITYGDHDLTDNIIHMVLARCEGAPEGSKGISLFIVPKILEDGSKNDLAAISLEHKLGIHASPTAVMAFGENEGAVGYLVGEENSGLKYMFTMMNNARLAVGIEGLAIAENSYQQALEFAKERVQGKKLGTGDTVTIINHPDIQRMIMKIKSNIDAIRSLILYVSAKLDLANHHKDDQVRQASKDIVDLLIPVIKAHATDMGFELSSEALQVFGGVGYVEETEIAQNIRDARIAMIYEGTNGIQAMDLVFRKLAMNNGGLFESYINDVEQILDSCEQDQYIKEIKESLNILKDATKITVELISDKQQNAAFIACSYLSLFGMVSGAVHLAQTAQSQDESFSHIISEKKSSLQFYTKFILPNIYGIYEVIKNGSSYLSGVNS